jgi:hypothetical protein
MTPAKPIRESDGVTVKVATNHGDLFITVNLHNETRDPYEIFIHFTSPFSENQAYLDGIGRLLSLYLRKGGSLSTIRTQLGGIAGPEIVAHAPHRPLYSIVDCISWGIEQVQKEMDWD